MGPSAFDRTAYTHTCTHTHTPINTDIIIADVLYNSTAGDYRYSRSYLKINFTKLN